jgi:hypothetical protein
MKFENLIKYVSEQIGTEIPELCNREEVEEFLDDLENSYYNDETGEEDNTDSLILIQVLRDTLEMLDRDQLEVVLNSLYTQFDEWGDDYEDDDDNYEIDENLDEAAKKIKRDKNKRRISRKKYKRNRASVKRKSKIYRKSSSYRRYTKRKKVKSRQNKTSTGKRIRKYI